MFNMYTDCMLSTIIGQIVAPFPPSDKIGVMSLRVNSEEVIDMENMSMGWVPYKVPLGEGYSIFFFYIYM